MGRRTFFGVVAFESVVGGESEMESVEFEVESGGLREDKGLTRRVEVTTVNGENVAEGRGSGSSSNDIRCSVTTQLRFG
jgi:hypothetical protein